jgi:osmoprotectant transport system substrate-binding protein
MPVVPRACKRAAALVAALLALAVLTACGAGTPRPATVTVTTTVPAAPPPPLPGTGRPAVIVGDKNYTEQFVLGELYYLALKAQGFNVSLDRNIGTTQITMQGLAQGVISFYPEYINVWDAQVAGDARRFHSLRAAYLAGQEYALSHGYELLDPSPFSDTSALAVNFNYGVQNGLGSIADLDPLAPAVTLGAPVQFQTDPNGLPAVSRAYGFTPAGFKPLLTGEEYQALEQGTVQVADVNTTDGQLITGNYTLLSDPLKVFGWGNAVPVVPLKVLAAEGPQFAATINRVSALLTTTNIRELNAAVDVDNETPQTAATQFLQVHGLLPNP